MIEHIDTGCKNHCDSLDHNIYISTLTTLFILSIHKLEQYVTYDKTGKSIT